MKTRTFRKICSPTSLAPPMGLHEAETDFQNVKCSTLPINMKLHQNQLQTFRQAPCLTREHNEVARMQISYKHRPQALGPLFEHTRHQTSTHEIEDLMYLWKESMRILQAAYLFIALVLQLKPQWEVGSQLSISLPDPQWWQMRILEEKYLNECKATDVTASHAILATVWKLAWNNATGRGVIQCPYYISLCTQTQFCLNVHANTQYTSHIVTRYQQHAIQSVNSPTLAKIDQDPRATHSRTRTTRGKLTVCPLVNSSIE